MEEGERPRPYFIPGGVQRTSKKGSDLPAMPSRRTSCKINQCRKQKAKPSNGRKENRATLRAAGLIWYAVAGIRRGTGMNGDVGTPRCQAIENAPAFLQTTITAKKIEKNTGEIVRALVAEAKGVRAIGNKPLTQASLHLPHIVVSTIWGRYEVNIRNSSGNLMNRMK